MDSINTEEEADKIKPFFSMSTINTNQKEAVMEELLHNLLNRTTRSFIAKNSFAKITFHNSNSYFGWLSANGFHGYGTYKYQNGTSFKGTFEGSLLKGLGRIIYPNGDIYEGEFLAGRRHGYGHYKSLNFKYSGFFQDGVFNGKGILKTRNGEVEGIFEMGKIKCGETRDSSGIFNGEFNQWASREKGKFTFANKNTYEGSWSDNKFTSFGEYKWVNEEKYLTKAKVQYVGYWLGGRQHNLGMLKLNQRCVICQWFCGKRNGAAIIIACNGSCFSGKQSFVDDQYKESFYIRTCEESQAILLEYFNFFLSNASLDEKTKSFLNVVDKLQEYSLFSSPVNPIRIPHFEIPPESFKSALETKYLQQVLTENYTIFKNVYKKYTLPSHECMNYLGLNLFYLDAFQKVNDVNVVNCLKASQHSIWQSSNYMDRPKWDDALAPVSFYQFFLHFVHITEVFMKNEELNSFANEIRPTFFGHLAIRVLIVLKMLENNETSLLVRKAIDSSLPKLINFLKLLENMFPEEKNIRTAYKFLKKYNIITENCTEFLEIYVTFYKEKTALFDNHYELSCLELIEIIFQTCLYKLTGKT